MAGSCVHFRASHSGVFLVVGLLFGACTLNDPLDPQTSEQSLRPDAAPAVSAPDASARPRPSTDGGVSSPPIRVPPEEMLPAGCSDGATRPCGPPTEAGICELGLRFCNDGVWSDCQGAVYPSVRRCDSKDDNDCDGQPDDTVDAVCACAVGSAEPCDTHPGLDGQGICKAGERQCVLAEDARSSAFGECVNAVGPLPADSCTLEGDDSNCDGTPNGGCNCVEGKVIACGPASELGICRKGTSVCINSEFTPCEGAVNALPRDCRSGADNDCDGQPDNTLDAVCNCAVGEVEACGAHPEDGVGLCKPGERRCVAGPGNATSGFGPCEGAVGPAPRRCNVAADANCDGHPDNTLDATCACAIASVRECEPHPGLDNIGRCRSGQQLCVAGQDNTSSSYAACVGAVGPAPVDSCSVRGDDSTCDGIVNGGCGCLAGRGNERCTSPTASRCDVPGVCMPCGADADCSHIAGGGVCDLGVCVECTPASSRACTSAEVCNPGTKKCVARPAADAGAPRTTR